MFSPRLFIRQCFQNLESALGGLAVCRSDLHFIENLKDLLGYDACFRVSNRTSLPGMQRLLDEECGAIHQQSMIKHQK